MRDRDRQAPQGRGARAARRLAAATASAALCLGALAAPAGAVSGWRLDSLPPVAHAQSSALTGVSCVSTTWCRAVGWEQRANDEVVPLADGLRGGAWASSRVPASGSVGSALEAVSCVSRQLCMAVGYAGLQALVERWNGATWSIEHTPTMGGYWNELDAVSCPTATWCVGVGWHQGLTRDVPLVETWNGRAWSLATVPATTGQDQLTGVSCTSRSFCAAVGFEGAQTLALTTSGGRWTIVASPSPAGADDVLNAVACASATSCVAVGSTQSSAPTNPESPLVESFDGTAWAVAVSPTVPAQGTLSGVDCTAPEACVAVGAKQAAGSLTTTTFAARLHLGAWTVNGSPNVPGWLDDALVAVSCTTATSCEAVGSASTDSTLDAGIAETRS